MQNEEVWGKITYDTLTTIQEDYSIDNYRNREKLIEMIINGTDKNLIAGIVIDMEDVQENQEKFINELVPRLKEKNIITAIKINRKSNEEKFVKVVDYIIK